MVLSSWEFAWICIRQALDCSFLRDKFSPAAPDLFVCPSMGIGTPWRGHFWLARNLWNVGGVPEIIDDGETGLLVETNDDPGLSRALRKVLDDSQFSSQIGMKLQQMVLKTFNWKITAENYLALIEDSRPKHCLLP